MRGGEEHLGVLLVKVAQTFEAKIDGDVVLVGQREEDVMDGLVGGISEDGLAHAVHGCLHTRRIVESEDAENVLLDRGVDVAELRKRCGVLESGSESTLGQRNRVGAFHLGREDTVVDFLKSGKAVPVETVESTSTALENEQTLDTAFQCGYVDFAARPFAESTNSALLLAIADEAVLVCTSILLVEHDAGPFVLDKVNLGLLDVRVCAEEVVDYVERISLGAENVFGRENLGEVVERVLDGVGCDDRRVVGFSVGRSETLTVKQASDSVFDHAMRRGILAVTNDAEDSDEVLAIGRRSEADV